MRFEKTFSRASDKKKIPLPAVATINDVRSRINATTCDNKDRDQIARQWMNPEKGLMGKWKINRTSVTLLSSEQLDQATPEAVTPILSSYMSQ